MTKKSDIAPLFKGTVISEEDYFTKHGFGKKTITVTLQELVNMKLKMVEELKSLYATFNGFNSPDLTLETVEKQIVKIERVEYNLVIIKEQIAICNVGLPYDGLAGINGLIYSSSGIKQMTTAMLNLHERCNGNVGIKEKKEIKAFLLNKRNEKTRLSKVYSRTQKEYNKTMKVQIELIM